MLLITRRTGEAIVINGTIEVKVLEVTGGRVKLGFEYPAGSSVFRQELFAKIQAENQAAALSSPPETGTPDAILGKVVQNLHSRGKGQVGPQHNNANQPANQPREQENDDLHHREPNLDPQRSR